MVREHLALFLLVLFCLCSPSDSFFASAPVFKRSSLLVQVRFAHGLIAIVF
jgi:hypothetical protein